MSRPHRLSPFPSPSLFVAWSICFSAVAAYTNTPFLTQSFFFDWNNPSQSVPIPVTQQCETIHIKWDRAVATGPNPVAPYFLQVYTSTYVFPFIISAGSGLSFDWTVPFAPGTQYQICMFDVNGNTGGCQATYTVIPSSNSPSCSNVSFPLGPLGVDAVVANGPMSQYGWIDQCTDISVTPKNGTPPYTFTVAPALHPPYNITSKDMNSINWTVSLSWAAPFFISVVDSGGNSWSNGPLHSGHGSPVCLAGQQTPPEPKTTPAITAGAGAGGLVLGAVIGAFITYLLFRRRWKLNQRNFMDLNASPNIVSPTDVSFHHHPTSATSSHYTSVPSRPLYSPLPDNSFGSSNPTYNPSINRLTQGSSPYQIEPFVVPAVNEHGELTNSAQRRPSSSHQQHAPDAASAAHGSQTTAAAGANHVYVVHHDGGRAPVTVYHQDGTEVVELPPRYGSEVLMDARSEAVSSGSDGRSEIRSEGSRHTEEPAFLRQSRTPGVLRKPRTPTSAASAS